MSSAHRTRILLVSTYEMGRQPFGLASPAAFLEAAGFEVACLDLSVQQLDRDVVERAELIAFYLPMHTAARIAVAALDKVRRWNPDAQLCAYGLYAPVSADVLRDRGVDALIGGEFEGALVDWARGSTVGEGPGLRRVPATGDSEPDPGEPEISWARQQFVRPLRSGLPPLTEYAHLRAGNGARRTVGYTEASRGCKHLCRHCPVVPIYQGRFRVVDADVVLADIDQQVAAGAEHITFGDPDFFNGPKHAVAVVEGLHDRHPGVTYDVTIKVEHLLAHADLLPLLRDTGCAFVTSAIEAVDDDILRRLDKGHTRADFFRTVELFHEAGLALQPTFVAFNPWITLEGYADLLGTIAELDLVDNVPSIQLAIRLLIPAGSRLLELAEIEDLVDGFDPAFLGYRWRHADARVDELQRDIEQLVQNAGEHASRRQIFASVVDVLGTRVGRPSITLPAVPPGRPRATIPYLSEPWYC